MALKDRGTGAMLSITSPLTCSKPPQVAGKIKEIETILEQEKITSELASESTKLNEMAQQAAKGTKRQSTELD